MAGTFALDISRFAQKANGRMDLVVRKISLDLFRRIILRSPVGNPSLWKNPERAPPGYVGGRFRGNWQVAIGPSIPDGTLELIDPTGTAAMSAATAAIAQVRAGDVITLANNLPYARRLEYGWSKQAPSGMVRTTLAEYAGIVAAAAE